MKDAEIERKQAWIDRNYGQSNFYAGMKYKKKPGKSAKRNAIRAATTRRQHNAKVTLAEVKF